MTRERPGDENTIRFEVSGRLPHKDSMLLIGGEAYKDGENVKLSFTVPSDNIFAAPDNALTPLAMIEMLAQLCGAQHSYDEQLQEGHLCGYLVGIDKVTFDKPVYAGDQLHLVAWKVLEMTDIKRVNGEVFKGGDKVGQVELTLYKTDQWMSLPEIVETADQPVLAPGSGYKDWARGKDAVGKGIIESIHEIKINHDQSVEAVLYFAPDFVGFAGHFPDYPVLPGVAIIYTGWLLAEIRGNKKLKLLSIRRAKFAGPVYPNDKVDVTLKHNNTTGGELDLYSVVVRCRGNLAAKYTIGAAPVQMDE
jgi:3-hydroxyacyl-[acyl-carrier-protein] dehydratase